jgi:hypothetical protein
VTQLEKTKMRITELVTELIEIMGTERICQVTAHKDSDSAFFQDLTVSICVESGCYDSHPQGKHTKIHNCPVLDDKFRMRINFGHQDKT